jgi:LDH2 family malate/lactate/ureidoglycolate dehydrogenase
MPADSTERVHLSVTEARALSEGAMRGIGYGPEEARILADHVIDAALCGYEYSGLPKLLNVADHPRFKAPRSPMRTLTETSVSVLFDGGNQSGMLGMYYATRAVIERTQVHGIALVGVNNIWMSGRSAYYVEMVARAGLIGIHTVAAPPMVAPLGGAKAALGTNPIAFGFPMEDDPLVIDLGTSAFMGTDLQFRQRLGIPLPEGVAIDEHGRATTDAVPSFRSAGTRATRWRSRCTRSACSVAGPPTRRAPGISSSRSSPICWFRWKTIVEHWPRRSPSSSRRHGRKASTRSAFRASARIASARVSRARASRSTGASTTR